jgi:hypothetical protein
MALELALRIKPASQIAEEYGISNTELAHRLKHDAAFKQQFLDLLDEWQHPLAAADRVRLKAAALAEDGLVELWGLFSNPDVNPSIKLDVHKHLSKLADVEPKRDASEQGSRFSVTINLPNVDPMEVVANVPRVEEAP